MRNPTILMTALHLAACGGTEPGGELCETMAAETTATAQTCVFDLDGVNWYAFDSPGPRTPISLCPDDATCKQPTYVAGDTWKATRTLRNGASGVAIVLAPGEAPVRCEWVPCRGIE